MGSDFRGLVIALAAGISIHAPRVGSDGTWGFAPPHSRRFQSTLPVWGATIAVPHRSRYKSNFNPRSPCGERPNPLDTAVLPCHFNPRSPCGERLYQLLLFLLGVDFNPRSPCGERRGGNTWKRHGAGFQSTLPVWGATAAAGLSQRKLAISIHAPRVGSDDLHAVVLHHQLNFNPRSPCGERLIPPFKVYIYCSFQSTLPVWGATILGTSSGEIRAISIHAPRVGSDTVKGDTKTKQNISIHAPRVGSDGGLPRL